MDVFKSFPKWAKYLIVVMLIGMVVFLGFSIYGNSVNKGFEQEEELKISAEKKIKEKNQKQIASSDVDSDLQKKILEKKDFIENPYISHNLIEEGGYTVIQDAEGNPQLLVKASNIEVEIGSNIEVELNNTFPKNISAITYFKNLSEEDLVVLVKKSKFISKNKISYSFSEINFLDYITIPANTDSEIALSVINNDLKHKISYNDNSNEGIMNLYLTTKEDFEKGLENVKYILEIPTSDILNDSRTLK